MLQIITLTQVWMTYRSHVFRLLEIVRLKSKGIFVRTKKFYGQTHGCLRFQLNFIPTEWCLFDTTARIEWIYFVCSISRMNEKNTKTNVSNGKSMFVMFAFHSTADACNDPCSSVDDKTRFQSDYVVTSGLSYPDPAPRAASAAAQTLYRPSESTTPIAIITDWRLHVQL